jgi:hypothetical protein
VRGGIRASASTHAHSLTCTYTHSHIQVTSLLECEEEIARLRCKVAGMEKWLSPQKCQCHSLTPLHLADSRLRSAGSEGSESLLRFSSSPLQQLRRSLYVISADSALPCRVGGGVRAREEGTTKLSQL